MHNVESDFLCRSLLVPAEGINDGDVHALLNGLPTNMFSSTTMLPIDHQSTANDAQVHPRQRGDKSSWCTPILISTLWLYFLLPSWYDSQLPVLSSRPFLPLHPQTTYLVALLAFSPGNETGFIYIHSLTS